MTILVLACFNLSAAEQRTLKFGIVPQQSATKLIESWSPLIKKMTSDCSCKIIFVTAPDITTFVNNVKNSMYDLVYLNPMHFVQTGTPAGYNALVREEGRKLQGIIIVKNDSPFTDINQLKDKEIAFPDPTSFAATVLVQNIFSQKNIPIKPVFVKSHASVYISIISGIHSAGGAINRTFSALPDADKAKLRILTSTDQVTPHPIAIHKRIDPKLKTIFLNTLTNLHKSDEGQNILNNLDFKNFVAAKNSDWNDVRKILPKRKNAK